MNNRAGFLNEIKKRVFSSDKVFLVIIFSVVTVLLTLGLGSNLKYALPLLFLTGLITSLKLKSFFVGFFLVSLFSFQLINPYKYYEVEAINGSEIANLDFKGGRVLRYGIDSANVILVATVFFFASEILARRKRNFKKAIGSPLNKFYFLALSFVIWGIGVGINYSPFPIPSVVWVLDYSQLFIVAFLIYYFYSSHRNEFDLIFLIISLSLLLQFLLSVLQVAYGSSVGIPIEATNPLQYSSGIEENTALFRASGTFLIPIELAIITLLNSAIIFPVGIKKRNVFYLISLLAGFATVILTQSRINWLGYVILISTVIIFYFKKMNVLADRFWRRLALYTGCVFALLSFVTFPRFFLAINTLYEGGGIELRKEIVTEGFDAFIKNPLVGYGAGTNEHVLKSFFPDGVMTTFPLPVLEGHLQLLLELGIIGVLFLVLPFYIVLRRLFLVYLNKTGQKNFGIEKINHTFTFLTGVVLINIHYLFQSHNAEFDFTYLGLILGFGMIAAYSKN